MKEMKEIYRSENYKNGKQIVYNKSVYESKFRSLHGRIEWR